MSTPTPGKISARQVVDNVDDKIWFAIYQTLSSGGNVDRRLNIDQIRDYVAERLDKAAVGLDQVDNTGDLDKPISRAVEQALEAKATRSEVPSAVVETLTSYGIFINGEGDLVLDEGQDVA